MKKLIFATALVASAAAFADGSLINATSFEGYTAGAGVIGLGGGDTGESGASGSYFCFTGGTADGSLVKAFGGDNLSAPSARTANYASSSDVNYLELNTEGGILWRSINTIGAGQEQGTYDLGTERAIPATGTYLDTLVQFTPTEDPDSSDIDLEDDDKLAIWLQVDSTVTPATTNLMVRAAVVDLLGPSFVPMNFTITNATVNAGEWYRLTVKAIANICGGQANCPAFQIRLDGQVLMSDTRTLASQSLEYMQGLDYETDVLDGALFASLMGFSSNPTLKGVGFKGSGALDDIVWTDEDLFPPPAPPLATVNVTVTGGANATATWTVNGSVVSAPATLTENDTYEVFYTANSGYHFAENAVTNASGTAGTTDIAITIADAVVDQVADWVDVNDPTAMAAINGKTAAQAYPALAGTALASADAVKLTRWATAKSVNFSTASSGADTTMVEAFLLNCAVTAGAVAAEKAAFVLTITFNSSGIPEVNLPAGKEYNGTLQLKGKANLNDASWTDVNAASSSYKFYMYELSL